VKYAPIALALANGLVTATTRAGAQACLVVEQHSAGSVGRYRLESPMW